MSLPEEMLLWRTVLDRALRDALGYGCNKEENREALQWIFQDSEASFSTVCDLAGLESDWVKAKLLKVLNHRKKRKGGRRYPHAQS